MQTSYEARPEAGTAADEARHEGAEAAAHLAASTHLIGSEDPELAGFFASFTRYASPEDLNRYTGAELAALVKRVFIHSRVRMPGTPLLAFIDAASEDPRFERNETLLVAVNDDIPFLYDSCTAEVRNEGLTVTAAFHPVIALLRDGAGARAPGGTAVNESVIVLALEGTIEPARAEVLRARLAKVFGEARMVVRDWKPMLARLAETIGALKRNPPPISETELTENLAFLGWLADNHFTFLGSRDYVFHAEGPDGGRLEPLFASGLGLLADSEMRVVRRGPDRSTLTPEVKEFLTRPAPLIITKANTRASVHRRAHMDYVGVKTFDSQGRLTGERRFIGLFTSAAYSQRPAEIPLLRRKAAHVLAGAGLPPASHDGKALQHILDTFPRDELFQISEDELLATALGILNLGERPKVRAFLRFDRFDRFVSALVYIPRERYNGQVRDALHALLARAFAGRMSAATPMLDDEAVARIHYIIGRNHGPRPDVDVKALEDDIRAAIRTWDDGFADALRLAQSAAGAPAIRSAQTFPPGYRDAFTPAEAVDDLTRIEWVLHEDRHLLAHAYSCAGDAPDILHMKLFVRGNFAALSDCLPVFEDLGLKVIAEDAFTLSPRDAAGRAQKLHLQNFLMSRADGNPADLERVKPLLEDAFHAVWQGKAESDGFNRLVVTADLPWRDIVILRSVAKFLRQAGINFSQAYMEAALAKNPLVAARLVALFYTRLEPARFPDMNARTAAANALHTDIEALLNDVPSADDDRILRAFLSVIEAMLRTSFFQTGPDDGPKEFLAFKLDSRRLAMLPAPKPLYEIFVYAPEVEGVHLRFGKVARGGIRWSDRAEDFRTEILGLVKAQQVKNAVIVPVGAKGGFYSKRMPANPTRDQVQAVGIAAYKTFIGALLDLTDNIGADGTILPPDCLRWDGDDPYLVVAADKGTASFSDIANTIAEARGYWLGDAFASGGSRGYDHKKMGITARGAWEAVKRHFRELGRDIQREPFTCIGVGDMSGDVFGNGMLLSKETRLLAAFDHRHIFFDPAPDADASFAERKRLFDLPRSSWADYDVGLISSGGGVFPRSAKEIPLSPEMQRLTGLSGERATPADIIRTLLTAPVDLLFFGGIGTFIKASGQTQADAGDRANDALRVNGAMVRARVIGEGANLGVTQLGRVEYARAGGPEGKGGRIDTDAIDNSAGVDTSDHEVNIKILLSGPVRRGDIGDAARDALLFDMTDDVARLVLKDNIDQTLALSVAESCSAADLDAHGRFMRALEKKGALDREVEMLPSDDALKTLARDGQGLTRPELAVLLAYAKLDLFHAVAETPLTDDPYFAPMLRDYFPPLAAERFGDEIARHRLAREIVATELVNRLVNLAGPLFAHRLHELSNAPLAAAARAFALADGVFGLGTLKARIEASAFVPAAVETALMADVAQLLRRIGLWFLVQAQDMALGDRVASYRAGFEALKADLTTLLPAAETEALHARLQALEQAGLSRDIAGDAALLPLFPAFLEIILLAQTLKLPPGLAAQAYFAAGETLGLDGLRAAAAEIATRDHWDRLALGRIVDDLYGAQRRMASQALAHGANESAVCDWAAAHAEAIGRLKAFLDELGHGDLSIAKLALANSQIQKLTA